MTSAVNATLTCCCQNDINQMTNTPRIIKNKKEKKTKKQVTGAADLSLAAHGEANSSAKFNWTI